MLQKYDAFLDRSFDGYILLLGNYAIAHNTHFQTGALKLPTSRYELIVSRLLAPRLLF